MSIARHHAEWLSLVEVSGPFLSLPVLVDAFPQGLEAHDPAHMATLRSAAREWEQEGTGSRPDPAIHGAWIRFVLGQTLGFPAELMVEGQALPPGLAVPVPEYGETLRPDLAIVTPPGRPDAGTPRLLVQILAPGQDVERPLPGRRWNASPATRMVDLLRGTGVRLGLVTNGEQWMLVSAPPRETSGLASWYAQLWLEEPLTLRAFRSLLSASRFFGVADDETPEALLDRSAADQQEVTDGLGRQVREAVEILIGAIDRIDKDRARTLLAGVDEKRLYESALTVMMRLVFLFAAEERGMLRLGEPLYDASYAVSTLRAQLRATADRDGEEVLERRRDAWGRLLATFRAVYGGVRHDRLELPAYGGALFDPDRFPFLEGRVLGTSWRDTPAAPLAIHNRTVLHLLEALQVLRVRVPGGGPAEARLLSFRALDIEQIGHVYEGLLDHTAVRAAEPILGLAGGKDRDPEIALSTLEELRGKGDATLVTYLKEQTGRSEQALKRALATLTPQPPLPTAGEGESRLRVACDNDDALLERVRPFAALLRDDTIGYPVVIAAGSVYVTGGSDRRSTGTHYTPRSLTEPIVRYTLEPVVYEGPAEGKPREEWRLRPAADLLRLKVCDMTMGSGAFLVEACRYLGDRLVEAWDERERAHPGRVVVTPEGELSGGRSDEQPLPRDPLERQTVARRLVVDRCLYGVDINPMAVEMAKLSLWLVTLQRDRPFTFLDHALRHGDALLGANLAQLTTWQLTQHTRSKKSASSHFMAIPMQRALSTALDRRRRLESIPDRDIRDIGAKERLLAEADEATALARLGGDLLVGLALAGGNAVEQEALRDSLLNDYLLALNAAEARQDAVARDGAAFSGDTLSEEADATAALRQRAKELLRRHADGASSVREPFHWPLEFPEVFVEGSVYDDPRGFDAVVGNPPFQGGQKITGALGTNYRDYLVEHLANGKRGSADLCAYFFLRARELMQYGGGSGLLATNTIAQGDTREVGLDQLVKDGYTITRAVSSRKWPGTASLEVAHVWVRKGRWSGPILLDDALVAGITPFLTPPGSVEGNPYRLVANAGKSFQGSIVLGMGFVLTPEEAQALIERDPRNRDVLFPYLNGEDLNSRPDGSPSRWVINFHDWPLEQVETYPDCMRIVREKVKPERDKVTFSKSARDKWWQFERGRPELYTAIMGMERVLVRSQVANLHSMAWVPIGSVYDQRLVVFARCNFAIMQSALHESWARQFSSTMRTDMSYTPTNCFETFPFPESTNSLDTIGERYYTHRQSIMLSRQEGLTKTYNRFHNPDETDDDIVCLRELHVEMDRAVAAAYGWDDLDLGHGFHQTKQGLRYTISEAARREVLGRLLALNHERYAQEVALGLHEKGAKAKAKDKNGKQARLTEHQGVEPQFDGDNGLAMMFEVIH